MTKSSSALMSLVAAVPAAFLAFLLVMAFLSHADKMGGTLNAVVGVALLAAVATALMPVGIVLFGGPKGPARAKPPKKAASKKDQDEADDDEQAAAAVTTDVEEEEMLVEEEVQVAAPESDDMVEEFDAGDDEGFDDAWDDSGEGASDEFEFDDGLSDDELDFDFEDEPKK